MSKNLADYAWRGWGSALLSESLAGYVDETRWVVQTLSLVGPA